MGRNVGARGAGGTFPPAPGGGWRAEDPPPSRTSVVDPGGPGGEVHHRPTVVHPVRPPQLRVPREGAGHAITRTATSHAHGTPTRRSARLAARRRWCVASTFARCAVPGGFATARSPQRRLAHRRRPSAAAALVVAAAVMLSYHWPQASATCFAGTYLFSAQPIDCRPCPETAPYSILGSTSINSCVNCIENPGTCAAGQVRACVCVCAECVC
jgi:hypothetical protein